MIRAIDHGVVHRICSGQVILDLATAVKEIVENALDAGASTVEVRLKEYGSELIEIADNGSGVEPANFQSLTLKYHTSKLQHFSDLQDVSTFGFRGEALSSLCALASITITTRTTNTNPAQRLSYDHTGSLVGTNPTARAVGTTVAVKDLFKTLPVRHKEFMRHIKREYAKLVTVLQAYALISTGVRMICTNQVGSAARSTVLSSTGGKCLKDNVVNVFGSRLAEGLVALHAETASGTKLAGFVSKAGAGSRGGGDRQFCYVNGRPVDLPKVIKVVNEAFRSLASAAAAANRPCLVLDIQTPKDSYDVNVTPDKRKVFLHHEAEMLQALQEALQQLWESARFTYQVNNPSSQAISQRGTQLTPSASRLKGSAAEDEAEAESSGDSDDESQQALPGPSQVVTRRAGTSSALPSSDSRSVPKPFHAFLQPSVTSAMTQHTSSSAGLRQARLSGFVSTPRVSAPASDSQLAPPEEDTWQPPHASHTPTGSIVQYSLTPAGAPDPMGAEEATPSFEKQTPSQSPGVTPVHMVSSMAKGEEGNADMLQETEAQWTPRTADPQIADQQVAFDLPSLRARLKRQRDTAAADLLATHQGSKRGRFEAASLQSASAAAADDDNASAAQELDRVFNQADFPRMRIIGQFNLGFIVVHLGQDLFIIDQHASDEKFNFERLASTTVLNKQPLLRPQTLDLSPGEGVTIRENLAVFVKNGFDIQEQANGQLALAAVPFSKNITFGRDDVLELVGLLSGHGDHQGAMSLSAFPSAATLHRPSRVRAMLAMRACRSSIMIGKALDMKTMRSVVSHLGGLESPWNCPHGRPTMRHLTVLQ
ncbi:hypothetical protein WJX82_003265 [Trebouxia sp. C0006]